MPRAGPRRPKDMLTAGTEHALMSRAACTMSSQAAERAARTSSSVAVGLEAHVYRQVFAGTASWSGTRRRPGPQAWRIHIANVHTAYEHSTCGNIPKTRNQGLHRLTYRRPRDQPTQGCCLWNAKAHMIDGRRFGTLVSKVTSSKRTSLPAGCLAVAGTSCLNP